MKTFDWFMNAPPLWVMRFGLKTSSSFGLTKQKKLFFKGHLHLCKGIQFYFRSRCCALVASINYVSSHSRFQHTVKQFFILSTTFDIRSRMWLTASHHYSLEKEKQINFFQILIFFFPIRIKTYSSLMPVSQNWKSPSNSEGRCSY